MTERIIQTSINSVTCKDVTTKDERIFPRRDNRKNGKFNRRNHVWDTRAHKTHRKMALKVSACGCVPVNNMRSAEVTPWVAYINREDRGASQVDSRRDPSTCPRDPSKRNALKCSLTSSRTAGILCFYARFRKCLEPGIKEDCTFQLDIGELNVNC